MTRVNFEYDAARQGLDEGFWKVALGSPSAANGAITLTGNATIISYGDLLRGEVTYRVLIPAVPTADDLRLWGVAARTGGSEYFAGFAIVDDVFQVMAPGMHDPVAIEWNDDEWTDEYVNYKMVWEAGLLKFYINDVPVAVLSQDTNDVQIPSFPSALLVNNEGSDNMLLASVVVSTPSYHQNTAPAA